MKIKKILIIFFGTTFFSGYLSKMLPGTIGSFVALIGYIILLKSGVISLYTHSALIIASFLLSVWAGNHARDCFNGQEDPKELNMDEVCGQFISLLPLTIHGNHSLFLIVLSFILFRVLDIMKPFPASYIDRNLKDGFGITLDDVFAGIYSVMILEVYIFMKF